MHEIFIEAESLREKGGWIVDTQSMESLHSSYVMAHGMGVPVADAVGSFEVAADGTYTVYAYTRDWTAAWDVKDPAGKYQLLVDGAPLETVLGTNGVAWSWQKAGSVTLTAGTHQLSLHDLTGFNGRCDCIYMTDGDEAPSEDIDALRQRLGWGEIVDADKEYDLIVVGGGIAGTCTALAAMRGEAKTLLIHDRAMLGGCNSSEVRVCLGGTINKPPYPNLGNVVKEIAPVMGDPSRYLAKYYEDDRKLLAFEASRNAKTSGDVRLNASATAIEMDGDRITAVIVTDTLTGKKTRYRSRLFADCSGDGILARLSGCETMYGREAKEEFGETLGANEHQDMVMGHSLRWYSEEDAEETAFPDIDWGMPFNDKNCLKNKRGDWEQETGFYRDMVGEIEYIRDFGLRAIYSNWSYQKNHYEKKEQWKNSTLRWVSPIGGKRESYRVKGDHILTQNDILNRVEYEDATACLTWSIDFHFPEPDNEREFGEPFRSFAYHRGIGLPYPVPYRCLYAKDVANLFLGGRIVSTSHVAFGSIRVMRTLGELGEVIGIAAALCAKEDCLPRGVYTDHLAAFKELLTKGVNIPCAFGCGTGNEEKYHYANLGWVHLDTFSCDMRFVDKFRRDIKQMGLEHRYPLPDCLK